MFLPEGEYVIMRNFEKKSLLTTEAGGNNPSFKKKIWIVNHNAVPPELGTQTRHFYFARYLIPLNYKIKIFASGAIHNTDINIVKKKQLFEEKIIDGVPFVFIKANNYKGNGLKRIRNLLLLPIRLWKVCQQFSNEKPDVIYASSPNILAAFSALIFAKKNHIKSILEIRDLWPESIIAYMHWSPKNPIIHTLYILEHWMYKHADKLIFTFEGGKQYIIDKGWNDVNLNKIEHLNNGVDYNEYKFNMVHYHLDDLELNDLNYFKIIYTGSVRTANNVRQIIDCAKQLLSYKDIKFIIYGTGNELENLINYCKKNNITNVSFKGWVDKKYIPYILSKSSLNLINYQQTNMFRYGGSQNKLFEYLASGKPIISNVQQNYCLISRHHCGISKALPDADSYAEAVLDIYRRNEAEYKEMCENAQNLATLYDYKKLSEELINIISDVINN